MLAYICTCGYVGFAAEKGIEPGDQFTGQCKKCGSVSNHFHGYGKVSMGVEDKIREFMNWVRLDKSEENQRED